jgi:NAD(P)-dependent dehydrogenase (short-subunit alcohol dehydrogenase family)
MKTVQILPAMSAETRGSVLVPAADREPGPGPGPALVALPPMTEDEPPVHAPRPSDVAPIDDWSSLLENKVAVVTGAGAGIGRAVGLLFAAHGAAVEIAEVDPERSAGVAEEITNAGGTARSHVIDVTRPADIDRLARAVLEKHGHVDVLVNNVGDYRPLVPFERSGPDSWDAMYRLNLFHVFAVTRAFVDSMVGRGRGSIVNVHSVEALRGFPGDPVYAAMKAGAAHFTTSLAVALGRKGVRVNAIAPDLTQTSQVDYLGGSEGHESLWASWAPVGRLGWPEDQARVVLFLASDLAGYVTGHTIPVDGGTRAAGGWFYSPAAGRFVNRPTSL